MKTYLVYFYFDKYCTTTNNITIWSVKDVEQSKYTYITY